MKTNPLAVGMAPEDRRPPARRIVDRLGVGLSSHLVQGRCLTHAGVAIDHRCLIAVRQGVKRLMWQGASLEAQPGDVVVIPSGCVIDINNDPAGTEAYEAFSVMLDPDMVVVHPEGTQAVRMPVRLTAVGRSFLDALDRAREAILHEGGEPLAVARHRVGELVVWLGQFGYHLQDPRAPSTARTVRAIAQADLAKTWTAGEIAGRLAMSEATMRRRLAAERTSFTQVLTDLRLSRALMLLQGTDEPISSIAFAVGYDSQSSLANRFRARFGHPPSAIRAAARSET